MHTGYVRDMQKNPCSIAGIASSSRFSSGRSVKGKLWRVAVSHPSCSPVIRIPQKAALCIQLGGKAHISGCRPGRGYLKEVAAHNYGRFFSTSRCFEINPRAKLCMIHGLVLQGRTSASEKLQGASSHLCFRPTVGRPTVPMQPWSESMGWPSDPPSGWPKAAEGVSPLHCNNCAPCSQSLDTRHSG